MRGCFILTPKVLTKAKEKMIVMHPLPRIDEIRFDRLLEYAHLFNNLFIVLRWTVIPEQHILDRQSLGCMLEWPCSRWFY